ncbi:MAG: tRNA (N(6)-L-threonylcarbamoyladenosine(37)-C(2))-methylthiotransferase MtaB [Anaerovoracaceae bacterium]|jgi:threonylcarbamoyladenosine tRNA methylthiotransferase MtaB
MKVAFKTLGCKVNQYETEALKEKFRAAGHVVVNENDPADIYVINTCTVTSLADRKSRQFIRRAKRINAESIVAVTGCYAQVSPDEIAEIDGVDIVAGTNEKMDLPQIIASYKGGTEVLVTDRDKITDYADAGTVSSEGPRTRAYIKIEDGCDRFCSYCAVPSARGPVRSRPEAEIVDEAEALIGNGYKELILTGINTALYGTDRGDGALMMEQLLERLEAIPADFRLRLSSVEPTVINADYVKKLFRFEKLCHSMHLSAQSGSDHVLSMMDRRYGRDEYLDIVRTVRAFDPYYGISTDIIAGFPGETEEDFDESLSLVREAGFSKVHAFRYSRRRGTKAAGFEGQVPPAVKKERSARLIEEGALAAERFFRLNEGRTERVLFEEKTEEGLLTGRTGNFIKVYADPESAEPGEFAHAVLGEPFKDGMRAVIIP